ncbi:MAG: hypothetical protein WCI31_03420 [Prolixibacteraceae bacterium]
MASYSKNSLIQSEILPVDMVFHQSWWNKHAGIIFDEDFYFHPLKRVEIEKQMEQELYERFGEFGLGANRNAQLPVIGPIHNASGYLISEMLGCKVYYEENSAPQVIAAAKESIDMVIDPFKTNAFKKLEKLRDSLKTKYGYVLGDVNWSGILNVALDVAGEKILMDFLIQPEEMHIQMQYLASVLEKFVGYISNETGTSSISVNRNVRNIKKPVFLHSECSHTMISTDLYEEFLMPIDIVWSEKYRPFGIHFCGKDPHRFAESFGKIKNLDFLDIGWGGDVKELRRQLPNTFFNLRLDSVNLNENTNEELQNSIIRLVEESANPFLTGVCCINMDDKVDESRINTIFQTVENLRLSYQANL